MGERKIEMYQVVYTTWENYNTDMMGGHPYPYDAVYVEADCPEMAKAVARGMYPETNYYLGTPRTVEEVRRKEREEEELTKRIYEERERKEAEKRARKEARENAKREAIRMTEEEYKTYTKHQQKIKRYGYDIKRIEREIAILQEELKYKKDWIRNNI